MAVPRRRAVAVEVGIVTASGLPAKFCNQGGHSLAGPCEPVSLAAIDALTATTAAAARARVILDVTEMVSEMWTAGRTANDTLAAALDYCQGILELDGSDT